MNSMSDYRAKHKVALSTHELLEEYDDEAEELDLVDLFQEIDLPLTEDERAAEEKKERRRKTWHRFWSHLASKMDKEMVLLLILVGGALLYLIISNIRAN